MGLSRLFPLIRLAFLTQTLVLAALAAGCSFNGPRADPIDAPDTDPSRPWLTGWKYRKPITLLASQIDASGNSALMDFPVLISITDEQLKASALESGQDIVFTADDSTTVLASEIESFTKSTGQLVAWVKVPTLSATRNTLLYVYYGHANPPAAKPTDVWNADYLAVWHLHQTSRITNSEIHDATIHGQNGTAVTMNQIKSVSGQIGSGLQFEDSEEHIKFSAMNFSDTFTFSMWLNLIPAQDNLAGLFTNSEFGYSGFRLFFDSIKTPDRKLIFRMVDSGGNPRVVETSGDTLKINTFIHLAVVMSRSMSTSTTAIDIYIDGAKAETSSQAFYNFNVTSTFEIGHTKVNSINDSHYFPGILDEVRVTSTVQSSGWILTSYRNQAQPDSFYMLGIEQKL